MPKEDINKIYEGIERQLDRQLLLETRALHRAIRKLEKEILESLVRFRGAGDTVAARSSLSRAVEYQKRLTKMVARYYGSAYDQYTKNLTSITALVEKEYGALELGLSFSSVDKDTFKSLRIAANSEFSAMGDYIVNEMTGPIYDSVLAGGSFKVLSDTIEGLLFKDGKGRFAYMADRKSHDIIMAYNQNNHLLAARRVGITDLLYYGNVIATTRPFCAERAGQIYNIKVIKSWDVLKWRGKKPGPTLINRGGYNCRHTMHPVKKRWIKEGRLNPQRWPGVPTTEKNI